MLEHTRWATRKPALLRRLDTQEKVLRDTYHDLSQISLDQTPFPVTAEWLRDNFYVIEQTLQQIREDLPAGYCRDLPQVPDGVFARYPRIFAIVWGLVAPSRSPHPLELSDIQRSLTESQEKTPLTIGELWALPTMLRIATLEVLAQTLLTLIHPTGAAVLDPLPELFAQMAANEATVGMCIQDLRTISIQSWADFFDQVSLVEGILRTDPAQTYARMDFETRNRYRSVIETLARRSRIAEPDIARRAIHLAQQAAQTDQLAREAHVGFYLIDDGRTQLERDIDYRGPLGEQMQRQLTARPTTAYLSALVLATVLILVVLLVMVNRGASATPIKLIVLTVLGLIPVSVISVNLVNWLFTLVLPPSQLPRLDFDTGVPAEWRTMVVIPALLSRDDGVKGLVQQLELHYLRNTDPHVGFALLTDFADAPEQHMPEDSPLLEHMRAVIGALNTKYACASFFCFHRERRWNASENTWMAWERKRGKLAEFNRLLRGATNTSYIMQVGDLGVLSKVQFVITLDADTVLPRGSANRLIATLAHPLNRPEFRATASGGECVVSGYTLLQPRTEVLPVSSSQSLFTRLFAGDIGLDPYTHATSDVFQDLFGEVNYVGKGIYDVDAFERSLCDRVPDNALLSHDLFEGVQGRAGLVSDIVLLEDYPPNYLTYTTRLRRWIRGDWQLLPWLMPIVPSAHGRIANPLSLINRWKILDNLRRSLTAPGLLLLLTTGWLWLPGTPLIWTLVAALTLSVPLIISVLNVVVSSIRSLIRRKTGQTTLALRVLRPVSTDAARALLTLVFLPYEAITALDAIVTTLIRLLVTHRNLLQWTSAASITRLIGRNVTLGATARHMSPGLVAVCTAVILMAVFQLSHVKALIGTAPMLLAWLASPITAFWVGRPIKSRSTPLLASERQRLRGLALRTWKFFEHFVGPDDNWLPPDHYQEAPVGITAHQTSPTNVGLFLLSALAAHHFGHLRRLNLVLRLSNALSTMNRLQRYRGHFLNWYDTRTLEPLPPAYVSTVDSGNLAGCLMTLCQGCLAIPNEFVLRWERWEGLLDHFTLMDEFMRKYEARAATEEARTATKAWHEVMAELGRRVQTVQADRSRWVPLLEVIRTQDQQRLDACIMAFLAAYTAVLDVSALGDLRATIDSFHTHLDEMQREWQTLMPGLRALNQAPAVLTSGTADLVRTWTALCETLPVTLRLRELDDAGKRARALVQHLSAGLQTAPPAERDLGQAWCAQFDADLEEALANAAQVLDGLRDIGVRSEAFLQEMAFDFLFNAHRQIFHIGYNLTTAQLDTNYYDLLASEARIASLIAIARGDVPLSHWLHLARPMTLINNQPALLSWSGTMFEYLMPSLIMRDYEGMFLAQASNAAIASQIAYGKKCQKPWGISESGYYTFDAAMNYQYRAFGVPGLGFKSGLADDLVIAPYASMLALPMRPHEVLSNLVQLEALHALGRYGWYEAIDFTPQRLPAGQDQAVVKSYMAHHQAMGLLALANTLCGNVMVNYFHADMRIKSVELLLQERIPDQVPIEYPNEVEVEAAAPVLPSLTITPWSAPLDAPGPRVHLLSNGTLSTVITQFGSGFSQWGDVALTRWSADPTLDCSGLFIYIQDHSRDALWSAALQPTAPQQGHASTHFHAHMAEFSRTEHDLTSRMDVIVVSDADVEIRRITLINLSDTPRVLRVTSYGEVVLADRATDQRHPAFNKLFIVSEFVSEFNALILHRRKRSATESERYMAHALVALGDHAVTGAYESDRARFIGRGRSFRAPVALDHGGSWLSGTTGATLDPIVSLGQEITLAPHESAELAFVTMAASSRETLLEQLQRFSNRMAVEQAFEQARLRSEAELRRMILPTNELEQMGQLLSLLLYPSDALRAPPDILSANTQGQSGLFAFGISGDYPIVLVHLLDHHAPIIRELLRAHAYWRNRGIKINLVFLNDRDTGYEQSLSQYLSRLLNRSGNALWLNRRDGIFIQRTDQLNEADRVLLETCARVICHSDIGTLAEQLAVIPHRAASVPIALPLLRLSSAETLLPASAPAVVKPAALHFDNGRGGFSEDGGEYVIHLEPGQTTPAPWINVIANPDFGCMVSETGLGCTWAINSGENRLTPWRNDPVSDAPAEAIYLRDEETTEIWSPTPLPAPAHSPYLVRHGAGYTSFEHSSHGLQQHVCVQVCHDSPVKWIQLRLVNTTQRPRRIMATYYVEWVLGTVADETRPFIVPEYNADAHALLARNAYSAEFGQRVAFIATDKIPYGVTSDRREFLGQLGNWAVPEALRRASLMGTVKAGGDICAALQVQINLAPGETQELRFLMGQGADRDNALALARAHLGLSGDDAALHSDCSTWEARLNTIQVKTPDPAMNLMLNRWLLYQATSCRMWGRSGLYQSSGAFGFRDQLQDAMALLYAAPAEVRACILNAARHQFEQGDVLHWWHPPVGRGVRTHCSDDLLWLPFVTARYVAVTGDSGILAERIPFLKGELLKPEEEDRYGLFEVTLEDYSLHDHCRRALAHGTRLGEHGLPLMGSGDWNDGMNRVGIGGKGESVWLGWFLHKTLTEFAEVCLRVGDDTAAAEYRAQAERIRKALEAHAWDGAWYRRAYYDDGTPLGSAQNAECQIDSIAQSWSVLSGAGQPERQAQAMQSVYERLVRPADQLVLLFTPPFDTTLHDPGYVKGYPPGVRENGGQYTHAAIWAAWAYAKLGDGDRAYELFHLLNPVSHSDSAEKMERYRVEPYVVVADIYGVPPYVGRGGWTWYTGSAGWLYRLGIEGILGFEKLGDQLRITPHLPTDWPGFELTYSFPTSGATKTTYHIVVSKTDGCDKTSCMFLDGVEVTEGAIQLVNDGILHQVQVHVRPDKLVTKAKS